VQRLGNGDQVHAAILESRRLRAAHGVVHARVRRGMRHLLGAGIGGVDTLEILRQRDSRLAAAGGAIPGAFPARRQHRQPGEQLGRITRPEARVIRRMAREMVFEYGAHGRLMPHA